MVVVHLYRASFVHEFDVIVSNDEYVTGVVPENLEGFDGRGYVFFLILLNVPNNNRCFQSVLALNQNYNNSKVGSYPNLFNFNIVFLINLQVNFLQMGIIKFIQNITKVNILVVVEEDVLLVHYELCEVLFGLVDLRLKLFIKFVINYIIYCIFVLACIQLPQYHLAQILGDFLEIEPLFD